MALQLEKELNREQCLAASTIDGPVLIIAGAGSGKTRMITFRIAHMLEKGIAQSAILALTFTNKAAQEMSERIRALTGKKLPKLTTATFHSFGMQLLRKEIHLLGYHHNFTIYDQQDKHALIKESARELEMDLENLDLYEVSELFSAIKTRRKSWNYENKSHKGLYEEYIKHLAAYNAVDFDDLIMMPIRIFEQYPDILHHYQDTYRYIMVDEFQDTSLAQYKLVYLLAKKYQNICVVGDDDQSIYSWRGANYENIMMFEKDFPQGREIKLEQNYRSTGTILAAANKLISNNTQRKEKELWTGADEGTAITLSHPEDESAEVQFIADKIKELLMKHRLSYDDFGVLVRTNSLLTQFEHTFMQESIPYTVSGGQSLFQRKEIKDIIGYMRVLTNPEDDVNFLRIINTPRRGIGRVSLEMLRAFADSQQISLFSAMKIIAETNDSPIREHTRTAMKDLLEILELFREKIFTKHKKANAIQNLIESIDYKGFLLTEHSENEKLVSWKLKNLEIFVDIIARWEKDPENDSHNIYEFLNKITLAGKNEPDPQTGKVNLMTIHASKGLEFHTVFLAGVEDHIIPHARSLEDNPESLEEERRLFYVAITRARKHLFITSCTQRRVLREATECLPSRFLEEIPRDLLTQAKEDSVANEEDASAYFASMLSRFAVPQ